MTRKGVIASVATQSRAPGPAIVIHSLAHATAALTAAAKAGRPVVLLSAAGAGIYAGAGWFAALVTAAREAVPAAQSTALLDCGDDAGAAMAAIRIGVEGIIFTGRAEVARRLADIAKEAGVRLETTRPEPALDFAEAFFDDGETLQKRCADILASGSGFC